VGAYIEREEDRVSATVMTSSDLDAGGADPGEQLIALIRLDGLVSGASGLALAAAAPLLDNAFGIPTLVLVPLGLFLVAYAGGLLLLARRRVPSAGVKAVIAGNALWAAASVVVVVADWLTLTTAGAAFVLVQAAAVAVIAGLQLRGLHNYGSRRTLTSSPTSRSA
jgi:hypothetical protein